jgi:hypothetical protein
MATSSVKPIRKSCISLVASITRAEQDRCRAILVFQLPAGSLGTGVCDTRARIAMMNIIFIVIRRGISRCA